MKWYEKNYKDLDAFIIGSFIDSEIKILALIKISKQPELEFLVKELYKKPITTWAHQEILAEDIINKYMGKIKKAENNLPKIVEQERMRRRI